MLFSSITFLYYFLPIVLLIYFLAPKNVRNGILLLASLIFYAWGEPKYVILMIASIFVGYFSGIIIERFKGRPGAKIALIISIVLCLLGLLYFKYADFFISNFNAVTGLKIPLLSVALPIGISFYTFQIISYVADVYKGDTKAQKNIIKLAAYIAMFPQLIAGPIVRYKDIEATLNERVYSSERIMKGITRFVTGLSKKVLIANVLGELINIFRDSKDLSVGFFWLYAVAFTLHIYFDFSGYSDMAIGLGSILGFDFPENFNYPYISRSITEYWRRWHMTLGGWFRDYVYIPLGGNRVSRLKWFRNIFIVWMLTGFWHGADWNFIIWGLYFAFILIAEKSFLLKKLQKNNILSHVYVIVLMIFGSVIFNASSMGEMVSDFKGLFGFGSLPLWNEQTGYYFRSYAVVMIAGVLGATPVVKNIASKLPSYVKTAGVLILLVICTAFLVDGSFNPFLYFRF